MDLVRRIEALNGGTLSSKAFREQVLARLRPVVPFDAHVFALTDPVTCIATSPHADVPMLPWARLPELIRWRYLTLVHRADRMVGAPASSLLTAVDSPSESLVWAHVLRDLGVVDTAFVSFADRYGAWGFLELWRTTAPFTQDEVGVLDALSPAVTSGLRASLARTFTDPAAQLVPVGPAVVVLGPDLLVRTQTEAAGRALLQLLPPEEPMAPIPAAAYNVGAALVAQEEGVPLGEPWSRVHLGGSRWVTTRASRLGADIAVSIEPSTPSERTDLMGRVFGLSGRESQVLDLLGAGLDSRDMASELLLSEHTVNDHVKAVLAKTGARTRQVLISMAMGALQPQRER